MTILWPLTVLEKLVVAERCSALRSWYLDERLLFSRVLTCYSLLRSISESLVSSDKRGTNFSMSYCRNSAAVRNSCNGLEFSELLVLNLRRKRVAKFFSCNFLTFLFSCCRFEAVWALRLLERPWGRRPKRREFRRHEKGSTDHSQTPQLQRASDPDTLLPFRCCWQSPTRVVVSLSARLALTM